MSSSDLQDCGITFFTAEGRPLNEDGLYMQLICREADLMSAHCNFCCGFVVAKHLYDFINIFSRHNNIRSVVYVIPGMQRAGSKTDSVRCHQAEISPVNSKETPVSTGLESDVEAATHTCLIADRNTSFWM